MRPGKPQRLSRPSADAATSPSQWRSFVFSLPAAFLLQRKSLLQLRLKLFQRWQTKTIRGNANWPLQVGKRIFSHNVVTRLAKQYADRLSVYIGFDLTVNASGWDIKKLAEAVAEFSGRWFEK